MIGEDKLKYITFALIFFLVFFISCQNILLAQGTKIAPPGAEEVKSFQQNFGEKVGIILQTIKNTIKRINGFIPFLKNIGEKISFWWFSKIKPWIEYQWNHFDYYIQKEIQLD
jgi:hypothetical protein